MNDGAAKAHAQCCYTTAYFVLPNYAFTDPANLLSRFGRDPMFAARFFYVMACKSEGRDPTRDEVAAVTGHSGSLDGRQKYHIVQFPPFPPVNIANLPPEQAMAAIKEVVLAPYFAAVVYSADAAVDHCFVLGQSPDGQTTLREVTREMNANLGSGCEPDLAAFIALLEHRLRPGADRPQPVAGVWLNGPPPASGTKRWWQFWR